MKVAISLLVLFFFSIVYSQTAQYPYPIIFVHGLNSNADTWNTTINTLGGQAKIFDVCLNHDGNNSTAILDNDVIAAGWRDLNPTTPSPTRLYAICFDNEQMIGHEAHDLSNQAAIYKQGKALKLMITLVLSLEDADKVILVGHSMGGLAIREYLQRTDNSLPTGQHIWWVDPLDPIGHKVAKVVTTGTPHGGSNSWNIPMDLFPDEDSEAVRDLRYKYMSLLSDPPNPANDNGVYLFGGNENFIDMHLQGFYNYDINCDGDEIDQIYGINSWTSHAGGYLCIANPNMPLIDNIDYTWITSDNGGQSDDVVRLDRQFILGTGDTILTNVTHTSEPSDLKSIIRGLDEPNSSSLAYILTSENTSYFTQSIKGYITHQTNYAIQDTDYYKFTIEVGGSLVLSGTNISFNNGNMTLLDESLAQIASVSLPNSINQAIVTGTYYIRITGDANSTSWQNAYTLSVNVNNPDPYEPNGSFAEATPIDVGMSTQLHTIYPSGDIDYIKFNVVQGYGYTILTDEETGVDVRFHVYRNDQSAIVADVTEEYAYVSAETGVNYIRVFRVGGTTTGNYTIRVLPAYWNGDAQIVYDNYYEPNPNSFCAYLLPTDGVNRFNLMEYPGAEDLFRITASQGNTYTAILSEENSVDVRMHIYFVNADHSVTAIAADVTTQHQWMCVQTGTYMIQVFRVGGLSEGDYKIRVVSQSQSYEVEVFPKVVFMYPGGTPYKLSASSSNSTGITWSSLNEAIATVDGNGNVTPVSVGNVKIRATSNNPPNHYEEAIVYVAPVGNYEPNGNFTEATSITVGMDIQSHTINASGDIDYIKFNVVQGYGYTILTDEETGVDVRFHVYRNDQSAIVADVTEEYAYVSAETGVNYIRVFRVGGTTTGNYTIRVLPAYWNGDAQIVYDNYYEPNPNSFCAYLLPTDGVNRFNLMEYPGAEDLFRITASQGNTYTAILSEENSVDVRMHIYFVNADHSVTAIAADVTTQHQWMCVQTGTYMIQVFRVGGLSEGDYKIRVVSQSQSYEVEVFPKVVFMYPGGTPYKLSASSSNSTGITWSSLNEAIATVDGNGNVTPVSVGNVKIRATSNNPPNHYEEAIVYVAPVGNYEPNGNFTEATSITVGMDIQSHTINASGDIDYIKFNVVQGYGYTILTDEETGVDVRFHVYRNDQSAIVADVTEEYAYVSAETGVNYIRVFRVGGTTTGNYTIRVLPAYWNGDAQIVYDNYYEPNPNSFCAYLLPTDGVNRFNLMEYPGAEDLFRITASQGNTYTAILSEENSVDVRMHIYFVNADHSVTAIAADVTTQHQWMCVQTGTYMIQVFRVGGLSEGDYKIRVVSQSQSYEVEVFPKVVFMYPGGTPYKLSASSSNSTGITWSSLNEAIATVDGNGNVTPVSVGNVKIRATSNNPPNHYEEAIVYVAPVGNYEPNGNFTEATSITVGMDIQSHTINASGDVDYIKFNVLPNNGYVILTDEETGVDIRFSVYRNDQSAIATGQETEYKYLSNETGVNYVRVYRYGGTATGNYTIRVLPAYWNGDAQILYDTFYEPNPNSYTAYLLPTDGVNRFNLMEHSADNDWFRITANQGDKDTVILSNEHAVDIRMNIYFENANHSLTTITSNQTTQYSWTCSQTGTYMIYVYRYGGLNEGDYKIRVGSLPSIQTFQLTVDVANGWNMVSIPGLHPVDQNVNTWWAFRDPGANVFRYAGGYQPVTDAAPGIGYWMKHAGALTYNTGGEWPAGGIQTVAHDPLAGASGWNLIGGYELIVTAANVTTNPPGLQSGPIYAYSGGYQVATTINPGYGYWIKLNAAGQIIIPESMAKGEAVEYFAEDWGRIILTDATGINYTLYAVKGETDLTQYELPPAPPTGMFDIRFNSGRIAEDINSSVKTIDMSGVTYPLTVRVEGMDIRLMDETGKAINVNLKAGEDIVISDASVMKLNVSGEMIPAQYSLEQNYPNPFNPSTVIEFSLPEDVSNVKLSIYNALGEKVAELVNTSLVAGKYQYQWNAKNIATGMYIYELRTDNFVSVKKMILIK